MNTENDVIKYDKEHISPLIKSDVKLLFFDTLSSTNTYLKDLALKSERICVVAKRQTCAKGRLGNSFVSDSGIYLSIKLPISITSANISCLTAFAGVKVCCAIKSVCNISPSVKWVNDIIFMNKKICGILAETSKDKKSVIIGVGVNTDHVVFPKELANKAGNLEDLCLHKIDKNLLAAKIIDGVASLKEALVYDYDELLEQYKNLCCTLGKKVLVCSNPPYPAYAYDIDKDCSLMLRDESGIDKKISFGEVRIRGLHGYI